MVNTKIETEHWGNGEKIWGPISFFLLYILKPLILIIFNQSQPFKIVKYMNIFLAKYVYK